MGQLIHLARARADHSRPSRGPAAFFFSPGCPNSYLAAERVERIFGEISWVPFVRPAVPFGSASPVGESNRCAHDRLNFAERQARLMRLPLVEPDAYPLSDARPIARAIVFAAEHRAGRELALAAFRLAFCGGFDLSDPAVIADAGAAADLPEDEVLAASRDLGYDSVLDATAQGLGAHGIFDAPAIRLADRWFHGAGAVADAGTFAVAKALYGAPLLTNPLSISSPTR